MISKRQLQIENEYLKYRVRFLEELKYINKLTKAWETQELLEYRIQKAIEIIDIINKQYEEIKDKDLITNRVVDISVIQEIENRLKGEEND